MCTYVCVCVCVCIARKGVMGGAHAYAVDVLNKISL